MSADGHENSHPQWRAGIVIVDTEPEPGSPVVAGSARWQGGDATLLSGVLEGALSPLDIVVPLQAPDGSRTWCVVRAQSTRYEGNVLVVEDDLVNFEYYKAVVTSAGLTVIGAHTGAEALAAAESHEFSLALIDIRLPDANGFELCRTLTSLPHFTSTPVLLMSADPQLADTEQVRSVGADGFIVNPIEPTVLSARIQNTAYPADTSSSTLSPPAHKPVGEPKLCFFGRARIEKSPGDVVTLPAGRSTDLLATLAAACPAPVSAERLARFVWLRDAEVSTNAVYTAVSRLRSFLADAGLQALVMSDDAGYRLDMRPEHIDIAAFEASSRALLDTSAAFDGERAATVLTTWVDGVFEGTANTLLLRWANRLRETRSRLIEKLAHHHLLANEPLACASMCQDLLADEPWREAVWTLNIVALYRAGQANDALQLFSAAQRRLRDELGLDPGPLLQGLELMVLSHDPLLLTDDWAEGIVRNAAAGADIGSSGRTA